MEALITFEASLLKVTYQIVFISVHKLSPVIYNTVNMTDRRELSNEFVDCFYNLLLHGRKDEVIDLVHNKKYSPCLRELHFDVIPVICSFMDDEAVLKSPEAFMRWEIFIQEFARKANPDDAVFEFLEQFQGYYDDVKFLAMLKPLRIALLRLSPRSYALEWCLNAIKSYVKSLPVPENSLEGTDSRPDVKRISSLWFDILPFCKAFVSEVSFRHSSHTDSVLDSYHFVKQRHILVRFILNCLERPFGYVDLEDYPNAPIFCVRTVVEEMLGYLHCLVDDILMFIDYTEQEENDNQSDDITERAESSDKFSEAQLMAMAVRENNISLLSVSVLYYLVFSERIQIEAVPCVYHPVFIFRCSLHLASFLLKKLENLVLIKGLLLSEAVLDRLADKDLKSVELDSSIFSDFTENIINIMVYCNIKEFRKRAVNIFQSYLFKFDVKGRYMLLWNLHWSVKHSGVRGFLITLLKDVIMRTLDEKEVSSHFTGKCLCDLVSMYCHLASGPKSDLLEVIDEVMSALNLIRFMALRDHQNKTGIWMYFNGLEEGFLKDIICSLKYSRECHKERLAIMEEERKEFVRNECLEGETKVQVTVGGEEFSKVAHCYADDQKCDMYAALNAFDLMENLLLRVKECLDSRQCMDEI